MPQIMIVRRYFWILILALYSKVCAIETQIDHDQLDSMVVLVVALKSFAEEFVLLSTACQASVDMISGECQTDIVEESQEYCIMPS